MPGWVGHRIILEMHLDALKNIKIDLPPEYSDVASAIQQEFENYRTTIEKQSTDGLSILATQSATLQKAQLSAHRSIVTGNLHSSITPLVSGNNAQIGSNVDYASYVELGRGPVYPVRAKALHFFTKTGQEVFAKHVRAADPRPYATESSDKLSAYIESYMYALLGD